MATCNPTAGKPDMYGLGIRVAFYIQWFGVIVVEYLNEAELVDIRILGFLLSAATFLGLVIQTAMEHLTPAEIYLVLLLAMSPYLFLVPLYLWKAFTCCHPYWDPFRWTAEKQSPIFKGMNFALLLGLASYGVWYWCYFIGREVWDCDQFGFLYSPVKLENKVFMAFNALFYLILLLVCIGVMLVKAGWEAPLWSKDKQRRKLSKFHKVALQEVKAFSNLAVAATMTAGSEFIVSWNNFKDVNNVTTVGQTIPLVLSAGIFCRVIFLHFARGDSGDDSSSDESSRDPWSRRSSRRSSHRSSHRSYRSRPPPGPPIPPPGPRRGYVPPPPPPG